uniref:NB-ARC domain-containing protein n=1 Tax=Kalanchoe fedtschenkoi TaxID=63787 RepID=A0A7N0VA54_KALFE
MTGPEVAAVVSGASKVLFTQGAYDFFFKWKLDEMLLNKLKALVNSTKTLLTVAEMRRQIQENSISDEWFKRARFAICDADDVLDKIFTDVQNEEYRAGDSPGIGYAVKEKLRYKGKDVGRSLHPFKKTREVEMNEIIKKLESVASEVSHLGLDSNVELAGIRKIRGEATSSVNDTITICGRSEDKKIIMKLVESKDVADDPLRVITIVGLPDISSKDTRKWDELRTPFLVGKSKSRIIITTHSKDVTETVTSVRDYYYPLNVMSEDESLLLFESVAFPGGSEAASPALKEIGRGIVGKCKGLPLAIKMIGRLLFSYRNDVTEWKRLLNSERVSSKQRLKEQYEDVSRRYFTHLLLNFFIQESSRGKPWYVLHDLVHDLAEYVSRGLCVDLHDINLQSRHLCYIQGKDEMLLNKLKVQKITCLHTFLPLVHWRHGLYLDNKILSDMLSNFKLLRVLSLKGYQISVLPDSVRDMKLLRYMNISWTDIECLPLRICRLYNLEFLNLSGCVRLKRLPADIVDLVKLRYLNVDHTSLQNIMVVSTWIVGMTPSSNILLRSLCIYNCLNLETLPPLGNLPALMNLTIVGSHCIKSLRREFCGDNGNPFPVLELLKIQVMEMLDTWSFSGGDEGGFPSLKELQIISCPMLRNMPFCFPSLTLPPTLHSLKIIFCKGLKTISDEFLGKCSDSLRELTIGQCPDLVRLPRSLSTFQSIQKLHLSYCDALESLPDMFHKATSLRTLLLSDCPKLVILEECGFPTALTHLTVRNCLKMKAVSNLRLTKLTSLIHLELEGSPETLKLEAGCLPVSVEELRIRNFNHLKSLSGT